MISGNLWFRVEWGDCDPAGIVFYPNFYRWFDASCHAMMRNHDFGQAEMIARHGIVGFPLIEAHAEFILPVQWEDFVSVRSQIIDHSSRTFTVQHRVYKIDDNDDDFLCVDGHEVRFWGYMDRKMDELRARILPDEFIAALIESSV